MIDKLTASLQFQQDALNLRNERQKVLAANIANADTPNYKARDFDFAAELARAQRGDTGLALTRTSARHLEGGSQAPAASAVRPGYRIPEQPSLDGNTVDMDRERAQFMDNSVRYQATLTMLGSRIQGLKSSMQSE